MLNYLKYKAFLTFEFLLCLWESFSRRVETVYKRCKYATFDEYFVSYYLYDKDKKVLNKVYDYDSVYGLCCYYVNPHPSGLKHPKQLTDDGMIPVGSFIKDGKQYYTIGEYPSSVPHQSKYIYCVLNDVRDLTHEIQAFKESIYANESLTCFDIVSIVLAYHRVNDIELKIENTELKLILDDDFKELVFKGTDILHITNDAR